ncbi:hypothetical protein FQA39_LY12757 [Lamprigera yunnana]|nr:hypothetical protein FQA39_LY12757 [Lamprigera yunnana]
MPPSMHRVHRVLLSRVLGVSLVNANDNCLCTTPAELRCMDASVSTPLFIVYLNFGFFWYLVVLVHWYKHQLQKDVRKRYFKNNNGQNGHRISTLNRNGSARFYEKIHENNEKRQKRTEDVCRRMGVVQLITKTLEYNVRPLFPAWKSAEVAEYEHQSAQMEMGSNRSRPFTKDDVEGCGNACSCRKAGLKCSIDCGQCSGQSHENLPKIIVAMETQTLGLDELLDDD